MEKEATLIKYECISRVIHFLNIKWNIEILLALKINGPMRFKEIKKFCISEFHVNIGSRTLSNRLARLTESGLLKRTRYKTVPPRVDYELTGEGQQFALVMCETIRVLVEEIFHRTPQNSEEFFNKIKPFREELERKLEADELWGYVQKIVNTVGTKDNINYY